MPGPTPTELVLVDALDKLRPMVRHLVDGRKHGMATVTVRVRDGKPTLVLGSYEESEAI
jgi:hypothetical protein